MGSFVEVIKTDKENKKFVYYSYQFSIPGEAYKSASGKTRYREKVVSGRLKIDKMNGNVDIIELAEGDKGIYAGRASLALIKSWKKGEFPEKTCWAS